MRLAWGNKVDESFRAAVLKLCQNLKWAETHASWLMACIAFETGETFRPSIKNAAGSGATGLIQFMPSTARGLGTTTEKLAAMSAPEQMIYVMQYMKPYAKRIHSVSDMYMAILAPKAVGKPDDSVLYSEGAAYRMNAVLDTNTDGKITKAEASRFVISRLAKGFGDGYVAEVEWEKDNTSLLAIIARIEMDVDKLKATIGRDEI